MHWKKKMTYVFLGVMVCPISVLAQVYDLNPVVVTANREIMSEMETPASVQVIEKDKMQGIYMRLCGWCLECISTVGVPKGLILGIIIQH